MRGFGDLLGRAGRDMAEEKAPFVCLLFVLVSEWEKRGLISEGISSKGTESSPLPLLDDQ